MSINILHISDLHFGTKKNEDKTRYSKNFVKEFIGEFSNTQIDYLIVSGDISNESKKMEYDEASEFLNKVVTDLKIPKRKVLICMGNHDISWRILEDIEDEGGTDLYKRKEKYTNFEKFYNDFYNEEGRRFKTDSIFVEIPDDSQQILFLGVNTCYRESNHKEDHYGCIDKSSFETYLYNMNSKYKGYVKCLVMHHNPMDLADEEHNFKNWREIDHSGLGYPFVVFCGHIHSSDGESQVFSDDDDAIHYISVGSLLQSSTIGRYNLYTINEDSTKLEIKYFNYEERTAANKHYWQPQDKTKAIKSVCLRKPVQKNNAWNDLASDDSKRIEQNLDSQTKKGSGKPNIIKPAKSILDEIKDNQLYYSGHFHWDTDGNGENSKFRSHGYIDINYLVSHIESLETITQLFKEKINEIQEKTKLDKTIMVSIGLECSVIGARLSVLFPEFGYSYIPRKHKANDHIDIENEIGFSDYNTVVLIKDITFDADESIEIIEKRFKNKSIHLISLFYCGKKDKKKEILSGIENARFYSLIDDIEIPRCEVSESDCPIIKNNLQTIYRC